MQGLLWKAKKVKRLPPIPSPSLSFYIWADIIWHGISLWLIWVCCPGSVPSQDLAHSQSLAGGRMLRASADAAPALPSSSQNTGVLPAPFWVPMQSTAPWGLLRENELHLSQTQYTLVWYLARTWVKTSQVNIILVLIIAFGELLTDSRKGFLQAWVRSSRSSTTHDSTFLLTSQLPFFSYTSSHSFPWTYRQFTLKSKHSRLLQAY